MHTVFLTTKYEPYELSNDLIDGQFSYLGGMGEELVDMLALIRYDVSLKIFLEGQALGLSFIFGVSWVRRWPTSKYCRWWGS